MGIVGGAVLTPAMGLISEWSHSISLAYLVPLLAYAGVALYSFFCTELSRRAVTTANDADKTNLQSL
jgi:FHS family L-fucose permease-like MFS transporter